MELNSQVFTFAMTIVTGIVLGGLFDCYRALRHRFRPRMFMTWVTDLLYWLVATVIMFIALLVSNWGELRFYVFIGVLSGLGLYYNWLSRYALRLFVSGIEVVIKVLQLLNKIFIGVFVRPSLYFLRMTIWPFLFVSKKVRYWYHTRWPKPPDEKT